MIRPICKDVILLGQKTVPATKADNQLVEDLLDTLRANAEKCVGMAANMIGVAKKIIVISVGPMIIPLINPVITAQRDPYDTEEGCLSLAGVRKTVRYQSIDVAYYDRNFVKQRQHFEGFTAQIIQHEIDHCNGILI